MPIPLPPKPLPTGIKLRIAQARALLAWERFAPIYLFVGLAVLVFAAGAFAGVWQRIGDPWRLIALVATLGLFGWTVWRNWALRLPNRSAAKRRLEADNALRHRPLDTLEDRPRISERGWITHYDEAEQSVKGLGRARLRPVLARQDRYYLRYLVPIILVAGAVIGWGDNTERLRTSLSPTWQAGIDPNAAQFEAWVDPPSYTGRRPVTLKTDTLDDVPEGSTFVTRITGIRNVPRLKLSDGRWVRAERLGPESFEVRAELRETTEARLRIGNRKQVWDLNVVTDQMPSVAFTEAPKADKRDRLSLIFDLSDDYGVETLALELRPLVDEGEAEMAAEPVEVPLRGAPVRNAEARSQPIDLSRHRWAGRKAVGILVVTDGKGQIARSEPSYFTVPNKIFIEPLAKAVVEQRALILEGLSDDQVSYAPEGERDYYARFDTWEPQLRLARAPEPVQRAAVLIDAVTEEPAGAFDDPAVYMGLRNVASRLRYARDVEALSGLDEDLWRIAIRAEFGRIGSALENMRRAQEQLNAAIARRAPQREVDTLFDRYNDAVDQYMEELRENAEMGEQAANGAGGAGGRNVDEIQELLDAIEEANRIGDTEGARLALARLAELLENMKIELQPGGGGGGSGQPPPGAEISEEMRESLEELADLLGEQRELRDDTEQAEAGEGEEGQEGQDGQQNGQAGQPGEGNQESPDGTGGSEALAERQDDLRGGLGTLQQLVPEAEAQGLGEAGDEAQAALDEAGEAMDRASQALGEGDLSGAQDAQDEAIAALREAGRGLAEALREQGDEGETREAEAGNPLGEQNGGTQDGTREQDLDGLDNARRSREILDELRRRAAEQERSEEERNYLDRLMKRF